MALCPWLVGPSHRRLLRALYLAVEAATRRIYSLYLADPEIRSLLPLESREDELFRACFPGNRLPPQTYFGRIDCVIDFDHGDWSRTLQVMESNMVGIGAAYYSFSASQIAAQILWPLLGPHLPLSLSRGWRLRSDDDVLAMILGQCLLHAKRIGRPDPTVVMLEEKILSGPCEFPRVAEICRQRGYRVLVADPRELEVDRGELYAHGCRADIVYRDPTVGDLLALEKEEGADLRAVWWAFRHNRVVSSLTAEFDHKGVLELFTAPRWESFLRPPERLLFRQHVLWTRVVRETRTTDPEGRATDLVPWLERHRERVILKPNRDYGGAGISYGRELSRREWLRALEKALRRPWSMVAQEEARLPVGWYPAVRNDRRRFEPYYYVAGVSATASGTAMLARISKSPIVNITRDGAIAGVLVAE